MIGTRRALYFWMDEGLQARQPHGLRLQACLILATRYGYPILGGHIGRRTRELLCEIAHSNEMTISRARSRRSRPHADAISTPTFCVASGSIFQVEEFAQTALGTSRASQTGFGAASRGNVTDEIWMKDIQDQKLAAQDDHFRIVPANRPFRPINPLPSRNLKSLPLGCGAPHRKSLIGAPCARLERG